ncbi:MAG: tetratricopeptide repeat protein [Caldilinea sp. CFX5]|nr:tetratricopeptide repeat protein [Caldilinea sp. CFX5]
MSCRSTLHWMQVGSVRRVRQLLMSYYPDFAELLDQYLSAQERSGAWLAQRLGVNPATVTRWRNGDSRPNKPEIVIQVADLLGVHGEERQRFLLAAGYGYLATAPGTPVATAEADAVDVVHATVKSVGVEKDDAAKQGAEEQETKTAVDPARPVLSATSFPADQATVPPIRERLRITVQKTVASYRIHMTVIFLVFLVAVSTYGVVTNRLGFRSEADVLYFGIDQWQNLTPGRSTYELILSAGTRDILYAKLSQAPQLQGVIMDGPSSRAGTATKLDYWVQGSYRQVNQVELTAKVINAAGELLGTAIVKGEVKEQDPTAAVCILDLQSQLAAKILPLLGVAVDPTLLDKIDETPTRSCDALRLNNQAAALIMDQQFAGAQPLLEQALALDPAYADAHNNLGQLYYRQAHWSLALAAYQQALALDDQNAIYEFNLGAVYERLGEYTQAVAAYQRALELNPAYVEAYNNLGFTYLQQGALDQALATLQIGLDLAPDAPYLHKNKGRAYLAQGNPEAAIQELGEAIDRWPEGLYAEALFYLALAHQQTGNVTEACNILTIYAAVAYLDETERATQADARFTEWSCGA